MLLLADVLIKFLLLLLIWQSLGFLWFVYVVLRYMTRQSD